MISARYHYSLLDHVATTLAFMGQSVPIFWFGLTLIILFSLKLRVLPAGGMFTIGEPFSILDRLKHLILPATMMGTAMAGRYIRFVRGSTLEVINQDYVRTARSKGLADRAILLRHVFKNAAIPVVTVVALDMPMLFSGALYTETIFSWPGTGRLFFDAAERRDYPVLMALIMTTATLIVLFNLLADLLYAFLDPRIRYE
jgi:peptide/nickel transport system permease protein